ETKRYAPRHHDLSFNSLSKLRCRIALVPTSCPEGALWIYTNVRFGPKHDVSGVNREGSISEYTEVWNPVADGKLPQFDKRSIEGYLLVETPSIRVGDRVFVSLGASQMLHIHIIAKI